MNPHEPWGIYIHYPFCQRKCHYCDFYFSTLLKYRAGYEEVFWIEWQQRRKQWLPPNALVSLYIGGGTPSLASETFLKKLHKSIYPFLPSIEFTIEVNPEHVSLENIKLWRAIGVNRISIGVQTLNPQLLQLCGRTHTPTQVFKALELLCKHFDNVSVDILFNLPNQTTSEILHHLEQLLQFPIKHFSVYGLTIEQRTYFYFLYKKGLLQQDETAFAEQFLAIDAFLTEHGFIHYEISNYGLKNYFSRHNLLYWNRHAYLGLGPSAHGFLAPRYRYANVANHHRYRRYLQQNRLPVEKEEVLSDEELFYEQLLLGLRLKQGIDLNTFSSVYQERIMQKIPLLEQKGWVQWRYPFLLPTLQGWLFHNTLVLTLMDL